MKILSDLSLLKSREMVDLECEVCRNPFQVMKKWVLEVLGSPTKWRFCSATCKDSAKPKYTCSFCGNDISTPCRKNSNNHYFCNPVCSAKFAHKTGAYKNVWTEERRLTHSELAKQRGFKPPCNTKETAPDVTLICQECQNPFSVRPSKRKQKYCGLTCRRKHVGGLRKNSTKVHRSMYKNFQMDSGAELLFAKMLDEAGISWIKNSDKFFEYRYEERDKKYYPDFFLPSMNLWVEIKGRKYIEPWLPNKLEAVRASGVPILLIDSRKLKDKESVLASLRLECTLGIEPK